MSGKVIIDDKDVTGQTIYDFNGKIGTVFQNPRSQFFNVDTTSEIAFGCENYGIEQQEILRRIGQAIGEMKIQNLMGRNLFALSGGGKNRRWPALLYLRWNQIYLYWMSLPRIWMLLPFGI